MDEQYSTDSIVAQPYYTGQCPSVTLTKISYRKQLDLEATTLEKRAADIRLVLAAFDENPQLERLLDAVRRLGV